VSLLAYIIIYIILYLLVTSLLIIQISKSRQLLSFNIISILLKAD